jgi:uncharacterized integral membrane protein (TIGR00697 family)
MAPREHGVKSRPVTHPAASVDLAEPPHPSGLLRERLYVVLSAVFLTALLVADVTAGKFFSIGGLAISVGVIPFPITFVLTDVVNEYYGRRGARFLTFIGMAMLVFAFLIITVARMLPVAESSPIPQVPFEAVFGMSFRFFGGSLVAYTLGQLTDIYAFQFYKRLTNSRHLWLRATGSTALSQVIDTSVVTFVALWGTMAFDDIAMVVGVSYVYKMVVAITLTPLCYLAHGIITDRYGIEPAMVEPKSTEGL